VSGPLKRNKPYEPHRALRAALRSSYQRLLPHLPASARGWLIDQRDRWRVFPPRGFVRLGSLRRLAPISPSWGARGVPIDRYYIEGFLERHAGDIRGRVLECYDGCYTKRFGGGRVTRGDVLNVEPDNSNSTFVGDLAGINDLPTGAFDCVIVTQVLHCIYDLKAAIATLHRILKPGGVILATVPGITPLHTDPWPCMWTLTTISAERLFREFFSGNGTSVESHGNVLAAIAFLHGLACGELREAELDHNDPLYVVTIAIRAVKSRALDIAAA
jgi:SAM-dependent methyltransferase